MSKIFIDSNIVLYLLDTDSRKSFIANTLISSKPNLNSQVLVEVINVCKRKFGYSKSENLNLWKDLIQSCCVVSITDKTTEFVSSLVEKYDFQIFDSIIVASAIESGCDTLYSEDMQDGLVVEGSLTIKNPFL